MAYAPDPTDVTNPLDTVDSSTASAEFRALKVYLQQQLTQIRAVLPTVGDVKLWTGSIASIPSGWIKIPATATTLSRATYPTLHTLYQAAGYPYGQGDGLTTFGIPSMPVNYTALQADAVPGGTTIGHVQDHTNLYTQPNTPNYAGAVTGYAGNNVGATLSLPVDTRSATDPNLAAGSKFFYILRVL